MKGIAKIKVPRVRNLWKLVKKTTSEGKLRPNFRLSWLVRAQVGGKMGNLTLLGGLRGTKLELKRALGAAKRAPRRSKSGPALIGEPARGVIFGPGAPPKVT